VLLVDRQGSSSSAADAASPAFLAPRAPARLYSDAASPAAVAALRALVPGGRGHTAAAPTASAAKAMDWWLDGASDSSSSSSPLVVSAADWISALLARDAGRLEYSDDNNALKAGWDPGSRAYEPWLAGHGVGGWLPPRVVEPGARTTRAVGDPPPGRPGLPAGCLIAGGTTDSIAAYVAALGPDAVGGAATTTTSTTTLPTAVTSLGSTLALKLASPVRVDDPASGVYSHRLFGAWLVGGASNVGCAALADFFSPAELTALSAAIDPSIPSPLDFYPLPAGTVGERFPVPDVDARPRVTPRPPGDDAAFLAGLLEGIARVEAAGYRRLADLGAPYPARVLTAGGGASNPTWAAIRARVLGLGVGEVRAAKNGEAAYGAALLARAAVMSG
jgi:D-ribulokinase